jgi:hypothetical protein
MLQLVVDNFTGIERNTIMFVGVSGYSVTQNYLVIAVPKKSNIIIHCIKLNYSLLFCSFGRHIGSLHHN